MSVAENVAFGLQMRKMPQAEIAPKIAEALRLVRLEHLANRLPRQLSGGQQQRVALARALVFRPDVLLLDEPLSNLDAKLRRRVREDIRELQQGLNLTVAYVTHDQEEALAVSDRIIVMSNARIAQSGTPRELYEEPANLFVADFIGDANILDGTVQDAGGDTARVRLGTLTVDLPRRGVRPGRVKVAVRPDAIRLNDRAAGEGATTGRIVKASYLGTHMEYEVESPIGELFVVDTQIREALRAGAAVEIALVPGRGVAIIPE
jgi:iron(III) transport system ATP-binding protein